MMNGVFANLLKLGGSRVIAQLITFALLPLLARHYSPNDFGAMGAILSYGSLFSVFISMQFDSALILPDKETDAYSLLIVLVIWAICLSFALFMVFISFQTPLSGFIGGSEFSGLVPWVAIIALFLGLNNLSLNWSVRMKSFNAIGLSSLTAASIGNSVRVLGVYVGGANLLFLVIASVLQPLIQFVILMFKSLISIKWSLLSGMASAWNYRMFPICRVPQHALAILSLEMPIMVLTYFYDIHIVGLYSMAFRVLYVPLMLVRESIRMVLLQHFREAYKCSVCKLSRYANRFQLYILIIGIAPLLLIFFWGDSILAFALGDQWLGSGVYIKPISVAVYSTILNTPSHVVLTLTEKNFAFLSIECIGFTIKFAALVAGCLYASSSTAISWFCAMVVVTNILMVLTAWKFTYWRGDVFSNA